MVLGKLAHYAFDAIAISTVLAGIKRSTGFTPDVKQLPESYIRNIAEGYLGAGETVFNVAAGQAVTSGYFKKT
ncbi:hypothetical protein BCR39DRAFT_511159 [Naematelia encephala]|uniref:DUF1748-domain-containing protein n=1 Tax=Naematelia encephala TaxID=71784 RepID=A0A1Y2BM08_9TREE|nr:hypothetical protein BCR39DRAFT_511159 [Naematelia encephala]